MINEKNVEKIRNVLQKHGQSHLLRSWDHLNPQQGKNLLAQIADLDFAKIDEWVAKLVKNNAPQAVPTDFTPPSSYSHEPADAEQQQQYDKARQFGKELIANGKVAAFVVAGGQGTRLGFDGPKGDFTISPIQNKTLFRIFAESIAAAAKKYQTACPWYIMTSPLNHDQTKQIFKVNKYYGLDKNNVFIFQQGTLPNFSFDGSILLADEANIASSPDGHGGSLKALFKSGAIDDMKKRGVQFVSYFQVDNPLINIFDPLFIGLHALENAQMSSKAVLKTEPMERVGNFCLVDGKVTVIEYSDLPDELAQKRNPNGSLAFELGSIAIHIINVDFIESLNAKGFSLPLHRAVKKIDHIDARGNLVEPAEPNGVKLETFVFDALPLATKSIILQTPRNQEFGPVKNATGTDSAETARQMMIARAADWLESAGIAVPKKDDGSPDCQIEIAPAFALEKQDIPQKLNQIPKINPGDNLYLA